MKQYPHHYVMKLAYRGSSFLGWQKTKEGPSIEEALETILHRIHRAPISELQAASRTDRGVHALGQIVDFTSDKEIENLPRFQVSLNQLLPESIACLAIQKISDADPLFHPTLSALHKEYEYHILLGKTPSPFHQETSWHVHEPIDLAAMTRFAQKLVGMHDFYGFCNQRANLSYSSTTRTILQLDLSEHSEDGWPFLTCRVTGDHFLYKMVRNIVGTLVWIGKGALCPQAAQFAFETKQRTLSGVTAPASGLFLKKISYQHDPFIVKEV